MDSDKEIAINELHASGMAVTRRHIVEVAYTDPAILHQVGVEGAAFCVAKNMAYGDAIAIVEALMRVLFPDGVPPDKFDDALLIIRVLDKITRLARGDKKAFAESPWADIRGYGQLGEAKDRAKGAREL